VNNPVTKSGAEPRVFARAEHDVSRKNISKAALKVLYRLKDGGYEAYLVGGCIRDLLLGGRPKDFDVATDATPEEVRALFGNSRLIGRRFRLAHIRFGREIIEVATFRAAAADDEDDHAIAEGSGRVLRDNVWGTLEDDVWRRDFTANALYYDAGDFTVIDYVGGVDDIRAKRLRLIGDPEERYREDPVRMLRAVRFAAKLDFDLDPSAAEPLSPLANLLDGIPAARLFDEFGKLFQAGHARRTFRLLREHELFGHLFPATEAWLREAPDDSRERFIEAGLRDTDERVARDEPITPMFMFAVFLWGPVNERAQYFAEHESMSRVESLIAAAAEASAAQAARIAIPRRFSFPMREIMQMQPRFDQRKGRRASALLAHRRFRAAYDLMRLRVTLGEVEPEAADWWTQLQDLPEHQKARELSSKPRKKRRRRRRAASKK
jgi:poly(A) polymerase